MKVAAGTGSEPGHRAEQVRLLYASLPGALGGSALVSVVLVFLLRNQIGPKAMVAWLGLMALSLGHGWVIATLRHRLARGRVDDRTWLLHFRCGVAASGLAWGLASLWLFVGGDVAHQAVLVVALAGVTAGALTSLAVDLASAALFTLPALVPLISRLFLSGEEIIIAMAVMLLVFLAFIATSALRAHRNAMENLQLRDAAVARERELRRSEELLEHTGELAAMGGWEIELASKTLRWTEQTFRIHGLALDMEPTLELAAAHYPSDARALMEHALQEAVEQGTPFDLELPLVTADGRSIWVRTMGRPRFELGRVVRLNGALQDISARKLAEDALIAAKQNAERANRAKSKFLSHMSHELRTPMNAVLGFAQVLQTDSRQPLSPEQAESVRHILRAGQHLLDMIGGLLDLARVEAGHLQVGIEAVDAHRSIDDCVALVRPLARARGIRIVPGLRDARSQHVMADPTRLNQVLINLLSNAIKFNRIDGSVQVDCVVEAGTLRIDVRDSGQGLDPADQQRLFRAFERLGADAAAIEGTGIGLVLCKQLVELMNGEIGVSSEVGVGSVFWVRLERVAADSGKQAVAPAMLPGPSPEAVEGGRMNTILYIEDNEFNTLLMHRILARRPDIRLITAALPGDGLELARAQRPDLILLDIQLPGMDGFEVLRRLRSEGATAHIPVIAVSANAARGSASDGFAGYLAKPLDLAQLWAALDRQFTPRMGLPE